MLSLKVNLVCPVLEGFILKEDEKETRTVFPLCKNGRKPCKCSHTPYHKLCTVKILKFGTPQTIAIIVLKIEKFDLTLH